MHVTSQWRLLIGDDDLGHQNLFLARELEALATDLPRTYDTGRPAAFHDAKTVAGEGLDIDVGARVMIFLYGPDVMTDKPTLTQEQEAALSLLVAQAATHVGRAAGRQPLRAVLRWVTRGRLGRHQVWQTVPRLGTPWQDTISSERAGWRTRAAYLGDDEPVFEIDYRICRRCRLGWVEQPYTLPTYQRRGLASAALAALRSDYPDLSWHTLGGHERDARPFWEAAGDDVPGGYRQREPCPHVTRG